MSTPWYTETPNRSALLSPLTSFMIGCGEEVAMRSQSNIIPLQGTVQEEHLPAQGG